jgi:DNA-binding transcriptional ArsR family regulator
MSRKNHSRGKRLKAAATATTSTERRRPPAPVFAALGDHTRLELVAKLSAGQPYSISQLTAGRRLTRQAITKHLHVLERAKIVRSIRRGREKRFEYNPQPIDELKAYLNVVSKQWDEALARLKQFVER